MGRSALVVTTMLVGMIIAAGTVDAQPYDHLNCYRAKSTAKVFQRAVVQLDALQAELPSSECEIKPRAKKVCFPASKTVTEIIGNDEPFPAQDLTDVQICYPIKCPRSDIGPLPEVSDQFGTRRVERFRVRTLCVPAVLN